MTTELYPRRAVATWATIFWVKVSQLMEQSGNAWIRLQAKKIDTLISCGELDSEQAILWGLHMLDSLDALEIKKKEI